MDANSPVAGPAARSHGEIRAIIVGVMLAMFLGALDQTIVATALPTIGRELGNFKDMPWVVTAYLVAATAVTPLYGKFSDIHGRRSTLLIAIVTFVIGSVACAIAPNMVLLIGARALQGVGGGGLISLAQTVVADVTAPRERGRYQVYFATVFAAASLSGPVLGGFLAEHFHWSIIFWINVPLGALAFAMSNAALKRLPRHERPHRLDVLGAALIVAASVTLMLALSWGGVRYAWSSLEIISLVAASALFWALFTLRVLSAGEPLIPLAVLGNAVVRTATASACFGLGTLIALIVYLPVFFEAVTGLSASQSGVALIPLTIGTVCGATASGWAMVKLTHYRRIPAAGLVAAMAGSALLALFAPTMPFAAIEMVLALISVGVGTLLPVTTVAVQNAVAPHELGTATGAMSFLRQLGGALMVAALGAILLGGSSLAGAVLDLHAIAQVAGAGEKLSTAFQWMFAGAFAGFALALLPLLFMEEKPFRDRVAPAAEAQAGE